MMRVANKPIMLNVVAPFSQIKKITITCCFEDFWTFLSLLPKLFLLSSSSIHFTLFRPVVNDITIYFFDHRNKLGCLSVASFF